MINELLRYNVLSTSCGRKKCHRRVTIVKASLTKYINLLGAVDLTRHGMQEGRDAWLFLFDKAWYAGRSGCLPFLLCGCTATIYTYNNMQVVYQVQYVSGEIERSARGAIPDRGMP